MSDLPRFTGGPTKSFNYNYNTGRYECVKCGALIEKHNLVKHDDWHVEIEKGIRVSAVKWCDPGDHAYKAGTPGEMSFSGTQIGEDGAPSTVQMDVCGLHSGKVFGTPESENASRMRRVEQAYHQDTIDADFTD